MLKHFNARWYSVPTVFIDTETTGTKPGRDRAVQVALVRFEGGKPVGEFSSLVDPGIAISPEATAIHGITDDMVRGVATIDEVFRDPRVQALLDGAQPAAYNAPFDRHFVPPFGDDWTWPWVDSLSLVRVVDRFERGKGRHRLEAAAARHGVKLDKAHDAEADARAAGELFYRLGPQVFSVGEAWSLGQVLRWQRVAEAEEWSRFMGWLSKQPPREAQTHG